MDALDVCKGRTNGRGRGLVGRRRLGVLGDLTSGSEEAAARTTGSERTETRRDALEVANIASKSLETETLLSMASCFSNRFGMSRPPCLEIIFVIPAEDVIGKCRL